MPVYFFPLEQTCLYTTIELTCILCIHCFIEVINESMFFWLRLLGVSVNGQLEPLKSKDASTMPTFLWLKRQNTLYTLRFVLFLWPFRFEVLNFSNFLWIMIWNWSSSCILLTHFSAYVFEGKFSAKQNWHFFIMC